jgi:hypothetical protein
LSKVPLRNAGALLTTLLAAGGVRAGEPQARHAVPTVPQLEALYADFNDAQGAVALIDSDPGRYNSYAGRTRAQWERTYTATRAQLVAALPRAAGESAPDARAIRLMRAEVLEAPPTPHSLAPVGHCSDAQREDLKLQQLQDALYACFSELANRLRFEGGTVTRVAAFDLLTRMPEAARRKALFTAFVPLWRALNGADQTHSPYRRMLRMAGAEARAKGSPIDAAAGTLGVSSAEVEQWLERILSAWSTVTGEHLVEPWDYRFEAGAGERELGEVISRTALPTLSERYYQDLGLDLEESEVIYDLDPRPGKAPLAYTDYVRRGRMVDAAWQPTIVRVSASYQRGGLGPLNELVHENGHAAHMLALRTRPAFMDLGDPLFYEAFADVPSWSVYEPAWQQKYLGRSIGAAASLRALYSDVMLDVAWALFDLRMLKVPGSDPNEVWTQITSRYLHVKPHPEFSWWAVRVQLVQKPGYMVNYGLGAVITADIREHIAQQLGPFATGDARWYGWLSEQLLRSGEEQDTAQLLRQFLGRPVSPQALLAQLQRVGPRDEAVR